MSKKAFIAVGHGGIDGGAAYGGMIESHINLNICIETEKELKRHGVNVLLSRYDNSNDPLEDEIRECNDFKPDVAFTQHVNAGGGDGCEFYISVDQGYTKGLDKELALNLEKEYAALGQNSRGIKTRTLSNGRDYYGFIREVAAPSVISEIGFIDNPNDSKVFDELHEQKAFGVANAKAILKVLNIPYIDQDSKPLRMCLDDPDGYTVIKNDQLKVRGWALSSAAITAINVYIDDIHHVGSAAYGKDRPDVFNAYPSYNNKQAGFESVVKINGITTGSHKCKVVVTDAKGRSCSFTRGFKSEIAGSAANNNNKYLNLHAHVKTWRVYPLNKPAVVGNEVGQLAPAQYGGLSYKIVEDKGNVKIIDTQVFGRVQIYAPADNDSSITALPLY